METNHRILRSLTGEVFMEVQNWITIQILPCVDVWNAFAPYDLVEGLPKLVTKSY